MTTPPVTPSSAPPTANGRTIVTAFVAIAVLAGVLALWMRYANRNQIIDAQLKAMPTLSAQVAVRCLTLAGEASELHRGDRCPPGSTISLAMSSTGFGTESVLYTLLSKTGSQTGALKRGADATVALGSEAGPRTLLLVLASIPLEAATLQAAVDRGGDETSRVGAVHAMVTSLIRSEKHARVERFDFEVSATR